MARFHKKTDEKGLEFNAVQHILVPATDIMKKELLITSTGTSYYIYDNGKSLGKPIHLDNELRDFMISLGYILEPHVYLTTKGRKEICGYPVNIDKKVKGKIHIRFSGTDAIASHEKFVEIGKYLKKCDPSIKGRCSCTESTKPNINCKNGTVN